MFRIALYDLKRMLKDKMFLFWTLIMPLGFIFFFAQIMKNPQKVNTWIPVFNYDGHELSQLFVEQLKEEGYNVVNHPLEEEKYIKNWSRALIIPATFSADLLRGTRVHVSIVKGEGNSENILSLHTRVLRTVIHFTGALMSVDVVKNRWTKLTREKFLEELSRPMQVDVVNQKHPALRPPPYGFALTLPGYLVMFVMMNGIMFGGITLAEDRTNRQLVRLIAAPLHPMELFLGKLLGRMAQPALQAVMILLAGNLLFGVSLGDYPAALLPVVACFAFFCGTIGILFGTIFSTEQQISSLGILFTMLMTAMGGCWWPIEVVPDFFKTIMMCFPTHWALQGFHDVMAFGKSFAGVFPECLLLTLLSAILLCIAVPLFEKRKRTGN